MSRFVGNPEDGFCRDEALFLVDEGKGDLIASRGGSIPVYIKKTQYTIKQGNHWPANETPFRWRFVGGTMIVKH